MGTEEQASRETGQCVSAMEKTQEKATPPLQDIEKATMCLSHLSHIEDRCDGFQKLFIALFTMMSAGVTAGGSRLMTLSGGGSLCVFCGLLLLGLVVSIAWASTIENLTSLRRGIWKELRKAAPLYAEQITQFLGMPGSPAGPIPEDSLGRRQSYLCKPFSFLGIGERGGVEHRIIPVVVAVYYIALVGCYIVTG